MNDADVYGRNTTKYGTLRGRVSCYNLLLRPLIHIISLARSINQNKEQVFINYFRRNNNYNTDDNLKNNQVNETKPFGKSLTEGFYDGKMAYNQIKNNYIQGTFASLPSINLNLHGSAFNPVPSAIQYKPTIIPSTAPLMKNTKEEVKVDFPNINLNVKKTPKPKQENSDERTSNKRNPVKKDITKMTFNPKFKNDGQNDDDDEDEEEDDEEEDPDLDLFRKETHKKGSNVMSPAPNKPTSTPGSSFGKFNELKDSKPSAFEHTRKPSHVSSPTQPAEGLKMRSMEEVKKSLGGVSNAGISFELPSAAEIGGRVEGDTPGTTDLLTRGNLDKLEFESGTENVGMKRKKQKDTEEDLSEVSLSEQDIETQDTIFGQYVKVNRTKQRYR